MARGTYSPAKRQREAEKARKKQDKAERRRERRERGPGEVEVVTAEELIGGLPTSDEALQMVEARAGAAPRASAIPFRPFVGGLSHDTTAEHLRQMFGEFGPVSDAIVVTDRDSGTSRGFGFVTMANRKDAPRAIEMLHGSNLNGRSIVVNAATDRR